MAEPSTFQTLVTIANGVLSIVACLFLIALAVGAVVAWRRLGRAKQHLVTLQRDVAPLLATMARVATNLETVTATVRSDVEAIHRTVTEANTLARAAVEGAEGRLRRLDSVVGAAQDEVEGALVDVVAAARGVRAGASVLRGILGLADSGAGNAAAARGRSTAPARGARTRGERAETFDRGDRVDAGDRRGDGDTSRGRPRTRSRRHKA